MKLTTDASVETVEAVIACAMENGYMHAFVRGLFFGTGMNSPRIVTLPLRPGLREFRTLDDFLVRVYVSRWNVTGFNECSIGRCYIDRFPPDSRSLLTHPFTIFYGEPGTPAPINDLVLRELVMDKYSMASQFRGNLLIVKHARAHSYDRRYDMIDVTLGDYVLLKPIVEWLIDNDFKSTGSTYYYPPVTKLAMPMPHSRSSFNMKIPCVQAYSNMDVAPVLFSFVGLKSMLALSRVSKDLSFIIREFYAARIDAMLDLAFDKFARRSFWFAMEAYHSYIGGSAAYWVMDKESSFAISNINILAPCNTQDRWSTWLVKLGCRELFFHDFTRRNFFAHAKSFRVFQSPKGMILSVSESETCSVMPLMLSGDSTAECITIGCHVAYILYPTLVDCRTTLPIAEDRKTVRRLESEHGKRWTFSYNTRYLGTPCHESCPALWRSTGGYGVEKFRWGNVINQGTFCRQLDWGGTEWRLNNKCYNPLCLASSFGDVNVGGN